MKIGLLTFAWDNNAGQYWQAVATYRNLCAQFPNAEIEIVRARHSWSSREGKLPRRIWLKPWRARRYTRATIAYNKGRDTLLRMSRESCLTHDYQEATRFLQKQGYDLLITGADVCLKPLSEQAVAGRIPLHWMSSSIQASKAMFASSADVAMVDDLSLSEVKRIRKSIEGLGFIGVRDKMTYDLVRAIEPSLDNLYMIPDPTFTLDNQDEWCQCARLELPQPPKGKKLALLHLPNSMETARIILSLKDQGYHPVTILGELPGASWAGSLSPQAWAGMSNIADLIVTVSFHESVFALKQGNAVLAVDAATNRFHPKTGDSKTKCLMSEFGLTGTNHYNCMTAAFDENTFQDKVEAAQNNDYRASIDLAKNYSQRHWKMLELMVTSIT